MSVADSLCVGDGQNEHPGPHDIGKAGTQL
jgi:hypothetical protein